MNHRQIIIRDSIVFAVAFLFVAAGLTDAVRLFTGLSWWTAVPFGVAFWGIAATLIYRHAQCQLAETSNETTA